MRKMKNKQFILTLTLLILSSCGDNKYKEKDPNAVETMNSGHVTIAVDNDVYSVIDTGISMYSEDYKKVLVNQINVTAREAMGELLNGNVRIAVIARDYLHDEDSLMKSFKVKEHQRMKIATDGLVLFCNREFPIDTLNITQVKDIFQNGKKLSSFFKVNGDVKYYVNEANSSVFANFKKLILEDKPLGTTLNYEKDSKAVLEQVSKSKGSVGIGYLSQVLSDDRFKMIEIGYYDSTGAYVSPKPVHQGYIVQGKYPFPVSIWVYLLEDRRNLPFWFASYLAKENKYQKVILDKGIVPEFARFQLVPESK